MSGGLGCASSDCNFNSQCGPRHYCSDSVCRQDCARDVDCTRGLVCSEIGRCEPPVDGSGPGLDAGPTDAGPRLDAGTPPGTDAGTPPGTDAGTPPGTDAGTPPGTDAGTPVGTRGYLDRCTTGGDCASGQCVDDFGGTRFCSRACAIDAECADEHVCAMGVCKPDDTGERCMTTMPSTCTLGSCLGPPGGAGACTRPCASAADCPAGYACTTTGGSATPICVDIEKPCPAGAGDCLSGLCLSVQGCTATCRSAADCPRRLAGLPAYTCAIAFGSTSPICVPPADIIGGDAAGAICRADPGSGLYLCRSAACDESAPLGPMCTQTCTAEGGCGPGLGCYPLPDGASITFACERAGSRDMSETCASARECHSGLCDATGLYCTRLCDDGLCPTGWTCETIAGLGVSICRR